jgi:predicted transcriptional regulator
LGLNVYERKILPLLRRPNLRKIIIFVLENKIITNKELSGKMSLSSATISWYIKILKDANLIKNETTDNGSFYSLMNEDEIIKVLIAYRESFLDRMVDRFIEAWDG